MSAPYRVHLLGFSLFERTALASYFRLATNRSPSYEQVADPADAHFLIVDADQPVALRAALALGREHDAVFIGADEPAHAGAWMPRPIDPLHVLRELDGMAKAIAPAPPAGAQPAFARTVARVRPPAPPSSGGFVAVGTAPPPAANPSTVLALLVDDSPIALRYLETRLQPMGITATCVTTSGKAIEALSQQAFDVVFIDVELGEDSDLDGLALCQHVKRQHHQPAGQAAPVVVMVSAHHSEVDRARGYLAGCDAYLGKPLDEAALHEVLLERRLAPSAPPSLTEFF
jgi:CheY-like chemotaxis protein